MNDEKIANIEENSAEVQKAIDNIISSYCGELDEYVGEINSCLCSNNGVTDEELDEFALNLSTLIYYVSTGAEQMGIRDDISKTAYKEAYNNARSMIERGTVADKNTQAELNSLEEHIVNVIYNKSYKILKAKVESAQEMLATVKKIMTRRVAELELSRMAVNGGRNG